MTKEELKDAIQDLENSVDRLETEKWKISTEDGLLDIVDHAHNCQRISLNIIKGMLELLFESKK